MKKIKYLFGVCFLICVLFTKTAVVDAASFSDINQSKVFVKQNTNYTCTLASAVMLVRRAALANGNSNWESITENSMRKTAWLEGSGLYYNFKYEGISVGHANLSGGSSNVNQLISLLNSHPEGIVIYDNAVPHAILVTDYTNGVFYCADPANNVPAGRIPISSASISLNNADEYWYVTSPKINIDNSTTPIIKNASYPSAVDLGSSFTAKGTIIADTQITWVWIGVQYGDGYTHALETSVNPMTTSYDISKISGNLNFSRLSAGDYTFQIDVIAGNKYYTIVRQPFKVEKKPNIPTNVLINTSKIELNGKATISWDAVDYATSYIIDGWSDGKEIMWKDVGNVTSYTLSNLSAGTYTFYVIASNDGMGSGSSQSLKLQVMDCKTSEMRYPSVIKSGTDFTVKGTITSNSEITWVWIGVQYGSGYTHALEVSANPMSVTYDISRISGALDFSSLSCGKYTFQIDAIIGGKYYEIIRKEFFVEKSMSITTSNSENKENLTTSVEESDQAVGEYVTDAKSNSVYRITGNIDGNRTVEYITPLGQKAKVTIPSIVTIQGKDYQVTAIANKAFKNNKKLKKIVIPSTVKKIGKQAFFNCKNLKNIVIKTKQLKNNVVGKKAFKGISAKTVIKVPKVKKTAYRKLLRKKGLSKGALIK